MQKTGLSNFKEVVKTAPAKASKLTDVHVHLDFYSAEQMGKVLRRADEAGIRWIVTSGWGTPSAQRGVEIATQYEQVLAAVGIHPWVAAEDFPKDFHEELYLLTQEPVTVAIGEVGIDYVDNVFTGVTYHDNPQLREAQEHAFRKQIALACEVSLPLITHCRGAYESFIPILKEERADRVGGAVHNFEADVKTAEQLLDMGFLLSFGGTITYPDETALREVVRQIPVDGILLETDSPYMPLYQQSTEQNEPAHVAQVASTLAKIKGIDIGELIDAVHTNFKTLLKLTDQKAV